MQSEIVWLFHISDGLCRRAASSSSFISSSDDRAVCVGQLLMKVCHEKLWLATVTQSINKARVLLLNVMGLRWALYQLKMQRCIKYCLL